MMDDDDDDDDDFKYILVVQFWCGLVENVPSASLVRRRIKTL